MAISHTLTALVASAVAGWYTAGAALPGAAEQFASMDLRGMLTDRGDVEPERRNVELAQSGVTITRPPVSGGQPKRIIRGNDCHRDVRTHRIYGQMVRHRHVGPNCEVRIVRSSN